MNNKFIIYYIIFTAFIIYNSITAGFFLSYDVQAIIEDSYDFIFLIGVAILALLMLLLLIKYYKNIGYSIILANRYYKKIIIIFIVLIILQLIQSLLFMDMRSFSIISKYIFYLIMLILGIVLALFSTENSISAMFKYSKWILIFIIILYIRVILASLPISLQFRSFRPQVLLGNANEDGGFISVFFPFLLFSNDRRKKYYIPIIIFMVIFFNGSKTTILVLFFETLVYLYWSGKSLMGKYLRLFIIVLILLSSIFLISRNEDEISFFEGDTFFTRGGIRYAWEENRYAGSMGVRFGNIWAPMIKHTLEESPIIGFGNGSWRTESIAVGLQSRSGSRISYRRSPHNIFLVYFVDWGLIGLTLMLIIYKINISSCIKILKHTKRRSNINNYSMAALLSWFSFIMWGLTANAHSWPGWATFILLIVNTFTILIHYYENTVVNTLSNQ